MTNDRLYFVSRSGIDTGKRLIQQQELGLDRQGSGDFRPATLTAGERVRPLPP